MKPGMSMSGGKAGEGKPNLMRGLFTVSQKEFITPHYIRITLTGDDFDQFAQAQVGDNNKIFLPEAGQSFTRASLEGKPQGTMRTYTLRALRHDTREMVVDFVAHGEEGPASRWAIQAKPGDTLIVAMKQKNKTLVKPADWYLLLGDHTALPVISVMLESLPAHAQGHVILEVYSEADILPLQKPAGVEITWLFNPHPGKQVMLPSYFKPADIPTTGTRFIFAAAEYQSVRRIREMIQDIYFLEPQEWQSFSYWKYGLAENDPANDRRALSHR